jgi:Ni/Co efflux regulator RcnB
MKKLFILLAVVFTYAGAQAQTTEEAKRVILGESKRKTTRQDQGDILGTRDDRRVSEENRYPSKNKSYKSKKYGKHNNPGKRLGWKKGVGNPHRTGAVPSKNHKGAGKGKGKKG